MKHTTDPAAVEVGTASSGRSGLLRSWPGVLPLLFVSLWLSGFIPWMYEGLAESSPDVTNSGLLNALAIYIWLWSDRRNFSGIAAQYGGLAMVYFWPLYLPIYLGQTRGWRRTLVILSLAALWWIVACVAGFSFGLLLATSR